MFLLALEAKHLASLGRYAGNRQLQLLSNGRLRWPFRQSGTGVGQHIELEPFGFLRRFLQHVLPPSFHRVRRFGWLHPGGRAKLNRVRALLKIPALVSTAEKAAWQSATTNSIPIADSDTIKPAQFCCPHCGAKLISLPDQALSLHLC